jgi:hypothetical protein
MVFKTKSWSNHSTFRAGVRKEQSFCCLRNEVIIKRKYFLKNDFLVLRAISKEKSPVYKDE